MRVIPASEWSTNLNVAKLTSLHIVAVLEFPADTKRAEFYSKHSAIAVADARCWLQHFQWFPRRGQSLERTRLGVPAKNLLRRRINY